MERMQGRQGDHDPAGDLPDERAVERVPGAVQTGDDAGARASETETGGLGGIGAEGVPTEDQRWPEDEPGRAGGARDEPSERTQP